jgi:hypothetical protein
LCSVLPPDANAWDSTTHKAITALAVEALPAGDLHNYFMLREKRLEALSVEPDMRLKKLYGKVEERRHYIDSEYYGQDPFSKLDPDRDVVEKKFGREVQRWGTLPWTINELATRLQKAFAHKDKAEILRFAGYLSHYVGDATQPLHTTKHWDGYLRDKGLHARFELAADHDAPDLARLAKPALAVRKIDSVWAATIEELRHSHLSVNDVIDADRASGDSITPSKIREHALIEAERPFIASQLARGASLLASIWLFEWQQAGSPPLK